MADSHRKTDATARLKAFVRGELSGEALEALERELDASPALQDQVAQLVVDLDVTVTSTIASGAQPTADTRALSGEPGDRHLQRGAELGRGGMARVFSATQSHLGREVAVKVVRQGAEPWMKQKLLQEARITGFLEHPGIVPVHDLVEDESGELQVVLKRIEGEEWSALMLRPADVAQRFEQEALDWHVSVAISVCRAVQFAHERGVVHRDIKPPNVMVGRFGEIYLLDWGVAGTLVMDPGGLLPCVSDVPFAGTLSSMAPEQVTADVARIGPRTDVYLLGTCLFEAMYGGPPHATASLEQRRANPMAAVQLPADERLPGELVAITRKALDVDPAGRFESADALRRALESFLKHRDGRRLAQRAAQRANDARRSWRSADRGAAELAASEAEFGFRAALELWPDDASTRKLSEQLAAERVRFALERGETQAASWLLGSVGRPSPTLVEQVKIAVDSEQAERDRLAAIDRDANRFFGLKVRRWLLGIFGFAWLSFWTAIALWPPATALPMLVFLLVYSLVGTAVVLQQRRILLEQRLNREMLLVHLAMQVVSMALTAVALQWDMPVPTVLVLLMLVWSLGMAAVAAIVEPASLVPAVVWTAGALASAAWPQLLRPCLALGTLFHVVWPVLVSLRLSRRSPRTP